VVVNFSAGGAHLFVYRGGGLDCERLGRVAFGRVGQAQLRRAPPEVEHLVAGHHPGAQVVRNRPLIPRRPDEEGVRALPLAIVPHFAEQLLADAAALTFGERPEARKEPEPVSDNRVADRD
jgi:hypothetical protein